MRGGEATREGIPGQESPLSAFAARALWFALQVLIHLVNAGALGREVGMNIEVHGDAQAAVAQDDAHGLVVAAALDAAGGKAVAQGVVVKPKINRRQTKAVKNLKR